MSFVIIVPAQKLVCARQFGKWAKNDDNEYHDDEDNEYHDDEDNEYHDDEDNEYHDRKKMMMTLK